MSIATYFVLVVCSLGCQFHVRIRLNAGCWFCDGGMCFDWSCFEGLSFVCLRCPVLFRGTSCFQTCFFKVKIVFSVCVIFLSSVFCVEDEAGDVLLALLSVCVCSMDCIRGISVL